MRRVSQWHNLANPQRRAEMTRKALEDLRGFVTFTRRTNDPKLQWLEVQLDNAGVPNRREGESFHAPILKVMRKDLDRAKEILAPVDEVPDDDPRFLDPQLDPEVCEQLEQDPGYFNGRIAGDR